MISSNGNLTKKIKSSKFTRNDLKLIRTFLNQRGCFNDFLIEINRKVTV